MRDVTLSRRDMLRALGTLAVGAAIAESPKSAAAERSGAGPGPTSWVDSAMPEVTHRMVETNGIRLHVAEQGEGPLIILCHGFPECWYSWRHQLQALECRVPRRGPRLAQLWAKRPSGGRGEVYDSR
jgi:hypothetical protein